jgi:MFS family permease
MAGSAFLSVAGGTVGDMFSGRDLGAPMMIYTASPVRLPANPILPTSTTDPLQFIGPEVGPLIGGFINQHLSWRWTFWIIMMWSGAELALIYFCVPETYTPVLLRRRAAALRASTGDERHYAPIERLSRSIPRTIAWSCLRPFQLLFFEPMVLLLCLFTALLLGVLYLFFQAFPLVFGNVHGFDLQTIGLTFLGLFVGMVAGILSDPFWGNLRQKLIAKNKGKSEPEYRLPSGILGGILVPIGLFWFSWTTFASVHWIVPIIASGFFGTGTLLVFSAVFTFLVDAYPLYAASALAANSFVRSVFAAAFPLFSTVMYQRLGYQWAGSVIAFLTLPFAPIMVAFMVWGVKIRSRSRFAGGK